MAKLKVVINDEEEYIEATLKPITVKVLNNLKKVEKENEDLVEIYRYFVQNCLKLSKEVEFDNIDLISLNLFIKSEYMDKIKLSEK